MSDVTQPYAQYRLDDNVDYSWTDMREVRPRTRMKLASGESGPILVVIDDRGVATVPEGVDVDTYEGEEYADVRAEGEAYWAARDKQNEEG